MAKKTITVEGQRRSLTGIMICHDDKPNYDAFLRNLPEDALLRITLEVSDPRQDWIDLWYQRAMRAIDLLGLYNLQFCKDTTILVERNPYPQITTSAPRHGDKYDRKTGIAVCYAKMRGETIPEYI